MNEIWRLPAAARELESVIERAVFYMRAACDADALTLAGRFAARDRFYVYQQIRTRGPRVAQLALSCPGLFLIARSLHRAAASHCVDAIYEAAIAGMKLNAVVDEALEAIRDRGLAVGGLGGDAGRVYVRRAPAALEAHVLVRGLVDGVELRDIPGDVALRVSWYEAVAHLAHHDDWPRLSPSDRMRLAGFVSRYALALTEEASASARATEELIGELVHYALRSGRRVPNRRCSPERVLLDVSRWHLEVPWHCSLPDAMTLRRCDFVAPSEPLSVEPIRSVGELRKEGATMKHCVAVHGEEAAVGEVFVFRVRYAGERLTVAASPSMGRLRLVEVAGPRNRRPSTEAEHAVVAWLTAEAKLG